MAAVRERSDNELPQDVVEAIDGLDGRARILEWRVRQGPRRDVDEQPDPVRDVLLQRPLQLNVQRIEQPLSVDPADLTLDSE